MTSPFVTANHYSKIIKEYRNIDKNKFDSLITVSQLKNFIWNENGAYNYDRNVNKWPFTQDLEVLYEINNAAFVCNKEVYKENKDRIGNSPKFFIMDQIRSIDIDTMDQFLFSGENIKKVLLILFKKMIKVLHIADSITKDSGGVGEVIHLIHKSLAESNLIDSLVVCRNDPKSKSWRDLLLTNNKYKFIKK